MTSVFSCLQVVRDPEGDVQGDCANAFFECDIGPTGTTAFRAGDVTWPVKIKILCVPSDSERKNQHTSASAREFQEDPHNVTDKDQVTSSLPSQANAFE
jgi:hypothetical protein